MTTELNFSLFFILTSAVNVLFTIVKIVFQTFESLSVKAIFYRQVKLLVVFLEGSHLYNMRKFISYPNIYPNLMTNFGGIKKSFSCEYYEKLSYFTSAATKFRKW